MFIRQVELEKLKKYCVYQDRCHQEVRMKLISLQVYGDELEDIVIELIREGYLNEERFAKSYARGKFRLKRWGRNKIRMELQRRDISDYCITKGLQELEESEYRETLKDVLRKRFEKKSNLGLVLGKDQAIKYAVSRGYESQLIFEVLEKLNFSLDNPS